MIYFQILTFMIFFYGLNLRLFMPIIMCAYIMNGGNNELEQKGIEIKLISDIATT